MIIDMIVPELDLCCLKSIKRKAFYGLEDSHTLRKKIDLIALVTERITSRRDQSIIKKMLELNILLNGMQKGLMASASLMKPFLCISILSTLTFI